jgi:hypothetical protein
LFHNATFFDSCIIHNLHTECANIKEKLRRQRVNVSLVDSQVQQAIHSQSKH